MAKKTVKKKGTGAELARVERERAAELATLRRLKGQQLRIVAVSRAVTRAVRRADLARIDVARELVQGTEWGIYGRSEILDLKRDGEERQEMLVRQAATIGDYQETVVALEARALEAERQRDELREMVSERA